MTITISRKPEYLDSLIACCRIVVGGIAQKTYAFAGGATRIRLHPIDDVCPKELPGCRQNAALFGRKLCAS